jgi:hypothetical protein
MRSSAPGLHASGLLVLPCRVHQAENRTTASTATLRMTVAIPATSMLTRLDAMRHFWRQSSDGVDLRQARWVRTLFTGAVEPPGCCSILLPWFRSVDAPPASSNRACRRRWPGRRPACSGFTKSTAATVQGSTAASYGVGAAAVGAAAVGAAAAVVAATMLRQLGLPTVLSGAIPLAYPKEPKTCCDGAGDRAVHVDEREV